MRCYEMVGVLRFFLSVRWAIGPYCCAFLPFCDIHSIAAGTGRVTGKTTWLKLRSSRPPGPQADPVFDDAAVLDTTVDMFDPQPTVVLGLVGQWLCQGEFLASWCLRRHEDLILREREGQQAQILQQSAPRGQGIRRRVSNTLVMVATSGGFW